MRQNQNDFKDLAKRIVDLISNVSKKVIAYSQLSESPLEYNVKCNEFNESVF